LFAKQVGYARFDDDEELKALGGLYGYVRLFVNFFSPLMEFVSKTHRGAQVPKRFDRPRTRCRRVLESEQVTEEVKARLTEIYLGLNPAELRRQIGRCPGPAAGPRQNQGAA
jgi:hypothetical protein